MPPEIVLGGPSLVIQVNLKLNIYLLNSAAILITFFEYSFCVFRDNIQQAINNKQTNNNDNYRINNIFFFFFLLLLL
jgi:hypothetical protein